MKRVKKFGVILVLNKSEERSDFIVFNFFYGFVSR